MISFGRNKFHPGNSIYAQLHVISNEFLIIEYSLKRQKLAWYGFIGSNFSSDFIFNDGTASRHCCRQFLLPTKKNKISIKNFIGIEMLWHNLITSCENNIYWDEQIWWHCHNLTWANWIQWFNGLMHLH